ncbi:tigger transposable element-derived protein 6-like [Parasteatoda tepidariorum]|uniref:tigger transposable element-derived protein 6-like n=1 Tax=Parasteatoda tepidariorum TaxID=114398 RepID=UPI0039BD39DE
METVDSFKKRISGLLENYKKEDIFNADECGLFYRAMPNKTLATIGDKCKDGKISKERITILLSCSSTGEKLKPLVIGKARKPRCFKKVNVKNLPVSWHGNKKAWMTSSVFTEWVMPLNKQMKQRKRKILLFINNCPAHPSDLSFSNVKVQFLPANTTSYLQPLDQGIIQAFNLHYRKFLLQAIIARAEECKLLHA